MNKKRSSSPILTLGLVALIITAFVFFGMPSRYKPLRRAAMAEAISNAKQVKYALDTFAMDNDGVYPDAETATHYKVELDGSSNAYFRQLFASGNTNSEKIFWVKGSRVCSKRAPDDVTTTGRVYDAGETLKPGDCGSAYVLGQKNADNPARPLLFDAPLDTGSLEFDPELWDKKIIVMRIDSSVRPERLNPHNRLMDGDNKELLTTASDVWGPEVTSIEIAHPLPRTER